MASRASRITFFVIFAITGFFFYRTMRPLFMWVGLAGFCAVLTYGPYVRLSARLGGRRRIAAALTTAGVVLVIIVPLFLTAWAVIDQGLDVAKNLQADGGSLEETGADGLPTAVPEAIRGPVNRLRESVPISAEQVRSGVSNLAQRAAGALTGVLAGATAVGIGLFLWILSLYYFYVDGEKWLKTVLKLVPMPERYSIAFFREFRAVSHAVFFGNILTAAAQGILGGFAFLVVGIPGAFLWGSLIFMAGILPMVGAALIWGPAGIWLIMQGRVGAGVFMLVWGVLVVGTVDNILRPILTKGQLEMHPLLVFLSIFGGLAAFGFAGIFLGPLFAALFLAAVRIYAAEFPSSEKKSPATTERIIDEGVEAPVH